MPLTDSNIEYTYNGTPGVALVWVIDEECLYDAPLSAEHAEIFMLADEVVDISNDYPDHEGVVVRLLRSGETKLELMTTEYFGSILLSNPLVVRLDQYPYGRYVVSPHARFDGEKFIILNRDTTNLQAWATESSCCS
jgi:hypothetical protein